MSAGERIPHAVASAVGTAAALLLSPGCDRIEVAGSLRRGSPTAADVELVCVPFLQPRLDLFGEPSAEPPVDVFEQVVADLEARGVLAKNLDKNGRPSWGPRHKRALFEGVPLDLYVVRPPATWGVILALRTGPAAFSHALVTDRRLTFGHPGVGRLRGLLAPLHKIADGAYHTATGKVEPTPEEADLFALYGLPPELAPSERMAWLKAYSAGAGGHRLKESSYA
jgi:hypothetical protein